MTISDDVYTWNVPEISNSLFFIITAVDNHFVWKGKALDWVEFPLCATKWDTCTSI